MASRISGSCCKLGRIKGREAGQPISGQALSLGSVEALDAIQARKGAKEAIARVQLGHDPQLEKKEARAPKVSAITLGGAVDQYLHHAERRLKASTYYGVKLHLKTHWAPLLTSELRSVERRHVAAELNRIATSSGQYGAKRSRAALSAFFSWAIGEGIAEMNPVVGTNKAIDEQARDRVLSDAELALVWHAAGFGDYGRIVRLLILTGQRREEVGGMLWSEIDLAKAMWSIGRDRTKNGLPHDIPLAEPSLALLADQPHREQRDLVFGASEGAFQGWSNAKTQLDKRIRGANGAKPIAPWRLHDLRRTMATRLGDIGTLPHVVEAILNHISGSKAGVAGIYNRASYAAEKRVALDLWAAHLLTLVEGT
jgi:integrase